MDDDEFEDSGFDDLNIESLQQLESQALRLHQQSQTQVTERPSGYSQPQNKQQTTYDYGSDDEDDEVIDLAAEGSNIGTSVNNAGQSNRAISLQARSRGNLLRTPAHDEPAQHSQNPVAHGDTKSMDLAALQARVAELEQDRTILEKSAEDARSAALSKSGEISIVRSNHLKEVKEYERRMVALQQQHAEDVLKIRSELDAARKDREKIETSNKFLEHDLAQELEKAKQTRKVTRSVQPMRVETAEHTSTPKKSNKPLPFRDGFDDDEVMILSPSKSKERRGSATPKGGSKRKRNAVEVSPAKPLEFSPSLGMLAPEAPSPVPPRKVTRSVLPPTSDKEKFEFMRQIVNHRTPKTRHRALDSLAQHSMPGETNVTVSSLVYDGISSLSPNEGVQACRKAFCQHLASIWSRLLENLIYAPMYELTELLSYILLTSPTSLSAELIPLLVPLCCKTIDLVTFPTANKSRSQSTSITNPEDLSDVINIPHYFDLLNSLAGSCLYEEGPLTTFWSSISFDFVLIMLHRSQPLKYIVFMLELLSTSVFDKTFGPIDSSNPLQQPRRESALIDRLTVLLFETPDPQPATPVPKPAVAPLWQPPKPPPQPIPYTPKALLDLRSIVLAQLRHLCSTDHGGHTLASHRLAFGRLVRFLHESVLGMYAYRPTHALSTAHVNASVTILAHLSFCHADALDLRARLAVIPQGPQKHLVALSRVAFAEGETPLEAGIEAEVAEAAHRMLDECLSPEEGEAVMHVFSSAVSAATPIEIDDRDGDTDVATTGEARSDRTSEVDAG